MGRKEGMMDSMDYTRALKGEGFSNASAGEDFAFAVEDDDTVVAGDVTF